MGLLRLIADPFLFGAIGCTSIAIGVFATNPNVLSEMWLDTASFQVRIATSPFLISIGLWTVGGGLRITDWWNDKEKSQCCFA
jgi:hypothetical protein